MTTAGGCRYRQSIPKGRIQKIDSNYGFRKHFLPQVSYFQLLSRGIYHTQK